MSRYFILTEIFFFKLAGLRQLYHTYGYWIPPIEMALSYICLSVASNAYGLKILWPLGVVLSEIKR